MDQNIPGGEWPDRQIVSGTPETANPAGSTPNPAIAAPAAPAPPQATPPVAPLFETEPSTATLITWSAAEFVAHHKTKGWYIMLAGAAAVLALATWLLTREIFATAATITGILLLGVYAGRQPRQQNYTLDDDGVTIGPRRYAFTDFRSFSVEPEGSLVRIELTPLQRFAMHAAMYAEPAQEEKIVAVLSACLPMEESRKTFTDSLMRSIRF